MRRFVLFIAAISVMVLARDASADPTVTRVGQQETQWCWAAAGEMLMQAAGGERVPQCLQATWEALRYGGDAPADCCISPKFYWCNRPHPLQLRLHGYNFEQLDTSKVPTSRRIEEEMAANRPVGIRWEFSANVHHFVVIGRVKRVEGKSPIFTIYDPSPVGVGQEYELTYDQIIQAGPPYHSATFTHAFVNIIKG